MIEAPSLITLENSHKLYLGNSIHGSSPHLLFQLGITRVVNITETSHNHVLNCEDNGILVLFLRLKDHPKSDISQYFEKSNKFIENALADSARVLVHCEEGISRSPTLVMAFLMYHFRYTLLQSIWYVRKSRPMVNPNNGFMRQLYDYEYLLFKSNSVDKSLFDDDFGSGALLVPYQK